MIEAGLDDERVSSDGAGSVVNQLVEYNVDRQVEFLRSDDTIPETETVLGFVYDFQGAYGDARGRCYLVNNDGETDLDALSETVPERFRSHVERLL